MNKTCLNCKYEPSWSNLTKGEFSYRHGSCNWDKKIPPLPGVYLLSRKSVMRFKDDSGVEHNCKA